MNSTRLLIPAILLTINQTMMAREQITIDPVNPGKTFEGIGALSAGAMNRG